MIESIWLTQCQDEPGKTSEDGYLAGNGAKVATNSKVSVCEPEVPHLITKFELDEPCTGLEQHPVASRKRNRQNGQIEPDVSNHDRRQQIRKIDFHCSQCLTCFSTESDLLLHERIHHGISRIPQPEKKIVAKVPIVDRSECLTEVTRFAPNLENDFDVLSYDDSSASSPADEESLVDEFVEDFMSDFDERFISSLLDDLVAQSLNDAYAEYMLYLVNSEEMLKRITFQGDSTAQTLAADITITHFVPDLQFKSEIDHF